MKSSTRYSFADLIFQKCSEHRLVKHFKCQLSSRCIFCRPHLSKVLRTPPFLTFQVPIELSLHILPTSKVLRTLQCKWSSHYSPAHFFSTTFPNRAPKPPKTLLRRPRSHITPKKNTRPRKFSPMNSHVMT